MSDFSPAPIPNGRREIDGKTYMGDGKGGWTPIEVIKPQDVLQDEVVRKIMGFTMAASEQVARLKQHTFNDISEFQALLAQEYLSLIHI